MQVGTASFYLPKTIATVAGDLGWHGKPVKIYACSQGSSSTRLQVFSGVIVEREKQIDAKTLTHYGWTFRCEDYVSEYEAQTFDISMYDDEGFSTDEVATLISDTGLSNFTPAPANTIRRFEYKGNGIGLVRAYMEQCGKSQYGGSGSFVGTNFVTTMAGVATVAEVFTVPEANGIKIVNRGNTATFVPTPGTSRNIFFSTREAWWIPAAWLDSSDDPATLHVVFGTYIKHPKVVINEDMDSIYEALYFGAEEQSFTEMKLSDLTSESDPILAEDYDPVCLIKPTEDSIETILYIHKTFSVDAEDPAEAKIAALVEVFSDNPEELGHILLLHFKEVLPSVITLHIQTMNVWDIEELTQGTEPLIEMNKQVNPDVLEAVAEIEFNEMQCTDYTKFRYGLSLVPGVPIPDHGTNGLASFFVSEGVTEFFIESTDISWDSGRDVVIDTVIRQPSTATASYRRVSEFSMLRQFKEVIKSTYENLDDAIWVKKEGGSLRFHFEDGSETVIGLSEVNMQDNGIIRVIR